MSPLPGVTILNTSPAVAVVFSVAIFFCYVVLIAIGISSELLKLLRENSRIDLLIVLLCAALAIPAGASGLTGDLMAASDSVEYGVAALNWVQHGIYGFAIDGVQHPPRYPFFLSIVLIAPWMAMYPSLKVAVVPIILHLMLIPILAACLGQHSRRASLALASVFVLLSPGLLALGGKVLTHIPTITITLIVWLLYLRGRDRTIKSVTPIAGALILCASLIRPLSAMLILPFFLRAWHDCNRLRASLVVAIWGAAPVLIHLVYNYWVFGQPLRTGYHYWCSIPYDYFELVFSSRYLGQNFAFLWSTDVPIALLVFALLIVSCFRFLRKNLPEETDTLLKFRSFLSSSWVFVLSGLIPVSILHLFYFFPNPGLHEALLPCVAITAGVALNSVLLPEWLCVSRVASVLGLFSVAICTLLIFSAARLQTKSRFDDATKLATQTGADDIVISGIDPVYLSAFLASGVKIVPISRRIEFASKFVAPRPLLSSIPPTQDWWDHRNPALLTLGATEVVQEVALDHGGRFLLAPTHHGRIWLDADSISEQELTAVRRQTNVKREGEGNLYRIE